MMYIDFKRRFLISILSQFKTNYSYQNVSTKNTVMFIIFVLLISCSKTKIASVCIQTEII